MSEDRIHRVGIGTDLHRQVSGGPLRLGGVDVDFDRRLCGHSDGDVVLHAVTDALCGAAGLPDIGEHFPDDDPQYADHDSGELLTHIVEKIDRLGYAVVNVDVVVHAERPK
ncbi:MAG: 2-C-methyl-D-erythritol 2,4-cyclodiphosphate synthase, partial [Phycisphaerae bacterium]